MATYNNGDIDKFYKDVEAFKDQITANETLNKNRAILEDKIKIAAFTELVFQLPKNERVISFQRIQEVTSIPADKIELMILKAMSLDLLRGSIDQVAATVSLTWIQPRVLDRARVVQMKDKFDHWKSNLSQLLQFVHEYKNSLN